MRKSRIWITASSVSVWRGLIIEGFDSVSACVFVVLIVFALRCRCLDRCTISQHICRDNIWFIYVTEGENWVDLWDFLCFIRRTLMNREAENYFSSSTNDKVLIELFSSVSAFICCAAMKRTLLFSVASVSPDSRAGFSMLARWPRGHESMCILRSLMNVCFVSCCRQVSPLKAEPCLKLTVCELHVLKVRYVRIWVGNIKNLTGQLKRMISFFLC